MLLIYDLYDLFVSALKEKRAEFNTRLLKKNVWLVDSAHYKELSL